MRISQRSIESVRETANIVEVASEFTALRRVGARFTGLCPYPDHNEKSPSFGVSPEKGFYHCFGCSRGGDAIKLVMELKNLPFAEAVSHLGERFGVELEFEGRSPEEERAAKARTTRRRSAYRALAAAAVYYHKYLLKAATAEEARRYLKGRGMERSTIEEFRLGYAPPRGSGGFLAAARKVGLDRSALDAAGLLSPRGGERFVERVTFPISDLRGRIVGFGARTLGDAKPKYLNSPETELFNKRSLLYGLPQAAQAIRQEKSALVVEGYTDVLMLHQSGIRNAVATLGTAMTEGHLKLLSGYADRVYLLFDPDSAGEKAVKKAEGVAELTFAATQLNTFLYVVRSSEDPADWLLEHSADEFRDLLDSAYSVVDYAIRSMAEDTRGRDAVTRHRATPEILDYVLKVRARAPALEMEAKRRAADALQVTPLRLEGLLSARESSSKGDKQSSSNTRASRISVERKMVENDATKNPLAEAGREVLAHAFARPDLAANVMAGGADAPGSLDAPFVLKLKDFGDETQAQIYALLLEHAGEPPSVFLSDERTRPFLDEVGALQAAGERLPDPSEASLRAAWFRLGALSRERAKARTDDFDEKFRLHAEARRLERAAVEASNLTLES